jgi:hypothetical protein
MWEFLNVIKAFADEDRIRALMAPRNGALWMFYSRALEAIAYHLEKAFTSGNDLTSLTNFASSGD